MLAYAPGLAAGHTTPPGPGAGRRASVFEAEVIQEGGPGIPESYAALADGIGEAWVRLGGTAPCPTA